jgi:hypothetical protein
MLFVQFLSIFLEKPLSLRRKMDKSSYERNSDTSFCDKNILLEFSVQDQGQEISGKCIQDFFGRLAQLSKNSGVEGSFGGSGRLHQIGEDNGLRRLRLVPSIVILIESHCSEEAVRLFSWHVSKIKSIVLIQ